MRKVGPERKAFVELAGVCMVCLHSAEDVRLECHEICRGASREKALEHSELMLAVCGTCHQELGSYSKWPIAKQIALKIYWEGERIRSLANDIRGRAPNAITWLDVREFLLKLA